MSLRSFLAALALCFGGIPVMAAPASSEMESSLAAPNTAPLHWAIGLGYPDLRLRFSPTTRTGLEAKAAWGEGVQVYSARGYLALWSWQGLQPQVGIEGGWHAFNNVENLSGDGAVAGAFVGLEYRYGRRMGLNVDLGPYLISTRSGDLNTSVVAPVLNTALYFYLF